MLAKAGCAFARAAVDFAVGVGVAGRGGIGFTRIWTDVRFARAAAGAAHAQFVVWAGDSLRRMANLPILIERTCAVSTQPIARTAKAKDW